MPRFAAIVIFASVLLAIPSSLSAEPPAKSNAPAKLPSGMPGPKGQPPAEVTDFIPPITILEANGFLDGGTTFVHLRDSRDARAILCVTQDAFETKIRGNSLMIGGSNSNSPSARFPLSQREAHLVVASLRAAVSTAIQEQATSANVSVTSGSDSAAAVTHNAESQEMEEEKWRLRFAQDALKRLENRQDFELADPVELASRTKRLESVDLNEECARFRDTAGNDREKIWERLKPVFFGDLKSLPRKKRRARILELLGPSEPEAEKRAGDPFPPPSRPTTRVAYTLYRENNYFRDLIFTFDDEGRFTYEELAIVLPPKHDKAKQ